MRFNSHITILIFVVVDFIFFKLISQNYLEPIKTLSYIFLTIANIIYLIHKSFFNKK